MLMEWPGIGAGTCSQLLQYMPIRCQCTPGVTAQRRRDPPETASTAVLLHALLPRRGPSGGGMERHHSHSYFISIVAAAGRRHRGIRRSYELSPGPAGRRHSAWGTSMANRSRPRGHGGAMAMGGASGPLMHILF